MSALPYGEASNQPARGLEQALGDMSPQALGDKVPAAMIYYYEHDLRLPEGIEFLADKLGAEAPTLGVIYTEFQNFFGQVVAHPESGISSAEADEMGAEFALALLAFYNSDELRETFMMYPPRESISRALMHSLYIAHDGKPEAEMQALEDNYKPLERLSAGLSQSALDRVRYEGLTDKNEAERTKVPFENLPYELQRQYMNLRMMQHIAIFTVGAGLKHLQLS